MLMKYRLNETEPLCLECGDPLSYGRSDRKFCSDGCRNRWHNREARQYRARYARVVGILQKNHEILLGLLRLGIHAISKAELAQLGYRPEFVTSCIRERRRMVCRCFDIVFLSTETQITHLKEEPAPWAPDP